MRCVQGHVLARLFISLPVLAALSVAPACNNTPVKTHDAGSADAGKKATGDAGTPHKDAAVSDAATSHKDAAASDAGMHGGSTNENDAGVAALDFMPSNFDPSMLDFTGIGDVDITGADCYIHSDTEDSRCFDPSLVKFTTITQSNQIKVGIYVARSWRIEPNAILTVAGPFPIILVATDSIDILGSLVAAAQGDNAVAGGYTQTAQSAQKGAGPGGGSPGSTTTAGGGGSYCGIGGGGGIQSGTSASGGTAYGTPEIVPLVAGSQGGGGVTTNGGAGGGAIQLVAGSSVSIRSGAHVNVGGGHGNWSGGGGGSGGALLIEAHSVTVAGVLAANGGGGQGGPGGTPSGDAMASDQPAPGSTSYDSGAAGGKGSAGSTINGSDGSNGSDTIIAGGGGGGAGRIRINTKSGNATLAGATLSPDATTSCLTQGTLKL